MPLNSQQKVLSIVSHGQRYGPLQPHPLLSFDVCDIPNPPRELRRQKRTTGDPTLLREWLLSNETFLARVGDAQAQISAFMKAVDNGAGNLFGNQAVIGVGCQLGRHRSVTVVEELARRIRADLETRPSWEVRIMHRDLDKGPS